MAEEELQVEQINENPPEPVVCQLCDRPGHTAPFCYFRFEGCFFGDSDPPTVTFTAPSNDPNWYFASGVTFQMIADMATLSVHSEYHSGAGSSLAENAALGVALRNT